MRLVRKEFESIRSNSYGNPASLDLIDSAIAGLGDEHVVPNEWFVACLSEVRDDLSQWRAYGRGEGGYAIGFSSPLLILSGAPSQSFLAPINYDAAAHIALAKRITSATVQFFQEGLKADRERTPSTWVNEFLAAWRDCVVYLAPVLKDPAFQAEHEWRVVHRLRAADVKNLKFRQKQTMMSRHLPLKFAPPDGSDFLPILQVMVGPCRHGQVSRVSVGDLLSAHGYQVGSQTVVNSVVPYQNA